MESPIKNPFNYYFILHVDNNNYHQIVVDEVVQHITFCRRSDWSIRGTHVCDWSRNRDVVFNRTFCRRSDWTKETVQTNHTLEKGVKTSY